MANDKVQAVNDILLKGEPNNISVDEHSGYTGYKPQAVVDAMNEVFWGEWGFEEISSEITPGEKGLAIAQVRVWLKGNDFKPTGWGQNRVTRGDIGDARKGAQTDAIKKALSYFSIGNRAYHGLLPDKKEQAQAARQQQQQATNQRQATPAARPAPAKPAQAAPERKPVQAAPTKAANNKPAENRPEQKPVSIPNFVQMRSLAERWYPDGWIGLRRDLIVEFDLGDIADDAWGEDLRKTAYERIKEAKTLKEDQPVLQAS